MKKISLLLALLLVLLLAGCGKGATNGPEKESETIPESTVSAEEAGFTLEDVVRANNVRTLVSAYGGVQSMRYEGDDLYAETYYFMYAGKLVATNRSTDPDGENFYSCTVEQSEYTMAEEVSSQMMDGTIRWIEDADEDTWRFELRDEENDAVACRCTVTKQSLTLKQIEWVYDDGTASRVELKHGAEVQTKEFGMLDGFAKDLRTVTCVCTLHDKQGKPTEKTYKVEVPYNVEPLWYASRELNVYFDKELTKAYKYPGNGEKDYTVYVTDAMG